MLMSLQLCISNLLFLNRDKNIYTTEAAWWTFRVNGCFSDRGNCFDGEWCEVMMHDAAQWWWLTVDGQRWVVMVNDDFV